MTPLCARTEGTGIVGTATGLPAGQSGFRIPVEVIDFYLLLNDTAVSWSHPTSYTMGAGVLSRGKAADVKSEKSCTFTPHIRYTLCGNRIPESTFWTSMQLSEV